MSLSRRIKAVEFIAFCSLFSLTAQASDYEKAHLLVTQQKWTEALPLLRTLHEEAPASMLVGQDLAQTLIRLNRREESMALLKQYGLTKQALIAGQSFTTQESYKLYQEGLNLLEAKKYSPACEKFEKALEKDSVHLDILLRLSQCKILDGNADAGLKSLETLDRVHGSQPEADLWSGKAYSMKGQGEKATGLFKDAIRSLPHSEIAPIWLAETLYANGQKESALAVLEEDLKKNPGHVSALLTLAKLRFSTSQNNAQLQEVQKELQVAQSRIEKYSAPQLQRFESDLGVELRDPETAAKSLQALSERLQIRLIQSAS